MKKKGRFTKAVFFLFLKQFFSVIIIGKFVFLYFY